MSEITEWQPSILTGILFVVAGGGITAHLIYIWFVKKEDTEPDDED